jgi:RNA polymerase sigma factor (sigma-70 family)
VKLAERITKKDIQRIASGDESPLSKVRDYVYKVITTRTGRVDDATRQDLTQETMLQILERAKQYNPQYAPSTFIGLMIRRSVQDWRQSRWVRRFYTNQGDYGDENKTGEVYDRVNRWNRNSPVDNLVEQERLEEDRERVELLRDNLGEEDYTMLHEHYGLDVPQQSIAVARNIPLGTVKSRFHRIKVKARRNVEKVA